MSALLKVDGLTKRFPGVQALQQVGLHVDQGELVAVVGENGAGKSTLMKILAGVQMADEGCIEYEGCPVHLRGVQDAQALGIALIHQELVLADNLDAAGNIFLGREPRKGPFLDRRTMQRRAQELLDRLGSGIDAATPVSRLSLGQRQMVEIAKALSLEARLLIMDEPTSSLSQKETETLFAVVEGLRHEGLAILYISHRLGEVKRLADRVVVLRDGRNAGELRKQEITHDAMIRLMVGRDLAPSTSRAGGGGAEVALEVRGLRTQAHPEHEVSFQLQKGELVGMAGLVGAGRTEILRALFGIDPPLAGDVLVAGTPMDASHPEQAIQAGLALVPEDRKALGIILPESVQWNLALTSLRRTARWSGWIDEHAGRELAETMTRKLNIKAATLSTRVGTLSGGNQQKVVLGKWLALHPRVLLLDEPTRGIDVGAKREIYRLMHELAAEGMAVLFVSSEMEEILSLSDRVLVMREGRLEGVLRREEASEEAVMRLATQTAIS